MGTERKPRSFSKRFVYFGREKTLPTAFLIIQSFAWHVDPFPAYNVDMIRHRIPRREEAGT